MGKKKVITGWYPKNMALDHNFKKHNAFTDIFIQLWKRKGSRETWHELNWPPHKVKITIEEL